MKQVCHDYLMEQFGDEEVSNEIYAEYVASIATKLNEAELALAGNDWNQLDRVAHAMKGNALAAGDNEVADAAIALRNAAKLTDSQASTSLIAKIKDLSATL